MEKENKLFKKEDCVCEECGIEFGNNLPKKELLIYSYGVCMICKEIAKVYDPRFFFLKERE